MPIGFSQSTGLPAATAVRTSCRWHAFGVVTSTASTSGQRQSSSVEAKTCGMPYCAAASRALLASRRDRATTLQFRASAKPGISRRTACKPKPAIPKRIMLVSLPRRGHFTFAEDGSPVAVPLCASVLPVVSLLTPRGPITTGSTEERREILAPTQRRRSSADNVGSIFPPLITATLIFVLG